MNLIKKYWKSVTLILLTCLVMYQGCDKIESDKIKDANLAASQDNTKYYMNRLGSVTATIKTMRLDKKEMQDLLFKKDKELAKLAKEFAAVHNVAKFGSTTKFEPIQIVYKDTVPCVFERPGSLSSEWYSLDYRSNQKGVTIDCFSTWTETTVITGTKRAWFLGKETVTTDITNSNPNITITDIKAAELVVPVPWYKKWYVWLGAGILGGILIK